MRFEFPAANELRDGAIECEGVEKIYVIGNEETGFLRVKTGSAYYFNFCTGEEDDAAAESALQPIVLFGIEKNRQYNQNRNGNCEVQKADCPKKRAAQDEPCALHT